MMNFTKSRLTHQRCYALRRGFNLVELLIALAITAALLTATLVALNASFFAYQATTEQASTHIIGRMAMNRMMSLIRTGSEFGPLPADPHTTIVRDDYIEFITEDGQFLMLEWVEADEAIDVVVLQSTPPHDEITRYKLIEGVVRQPDPDDPSEHIRPFALEYKLGSQLYRATVDLTIVPDDNMDVTLDGGNEQIIRLVASTMPRSVAY